MSKPKEHIPVLLREAIDALKIKPDGIYVDGTVGAGGHAIEMATLLDENKGRLIGFDLDPNAIEVAQKHLELLGDRVRLINNSYAKMKSELEKLGIELVDGVLLDLGYSSMQIDDPDRGFSFQHNAPLDMRYSPTQTTMASDIIHEAPKEKLISIFRDYGEERWAARIAARIVEQRSEKPIRTTAVLAELIINAIPKAAQHPKGLKKKPSHPATRVFQALRIAVNRELEVLSQGLDSAFELLRSDGRLAVISFHSLEDRIVKQFMRSKVQGCTCPPDLPLCVCGFEPLAEVFPDIAPSTQEIEANPRARSARLRVLRKL